MRTLALPLIVLSGCGDVIGPADGSLYVYSTEVEAPAVADSLWQTLSECAGVIPPVRVDDLRWRRVEADYFMCGDFHLRTFGCHDRPVDIYLSRWIYDQPWWYAARHEMLHAWLGADEPPEHTHPAWTSCSEERRLPNPLIPD